MKQTAASQLRGARWKRSAFSLVELMLVIAIITVIGGIALPRYSQSVARYRVSAAAQRLVADVALAQAAARAASASRAIVFTAGSSGGYSMANVTDMNTGASTYTIRLAGEPYYAQISSVTSSNPAAALTGGGVSITFDGFGVGDGTLTVTLQSGVAQKTVTVDPATGRCAVQ